MKFFRHSMIPVSFMLCSALLSMSTSAISADSCSPASKHQDKFERFMIDDVPSLLESCGLGDLIIDLPGFGGGGSGGGDLFCGFKASDLSSWYDDYSGSNTGRFFGSSSKPLPISSASSGSAATSKPVKTGQPKNNESWNPASLFKNGN
ncbi:hypothetical protein [Shewanella colwelliana]|uniref:hypothetical protein n=1 Tax=Shewanella colwelliana TaxID=23 RepID=UPI0022AEB07B|nr:hypothetical protein [Shewanella colwelliana]MCZ4337815.1 hypothetical protein [Shewanella colwelliana]